MIHPSTRPRLLRVFAGILLVASMACNKKLPDGLPCGCEADPVVTKKGNFPQKLAICGTLNLPIDSALSPAALVSAYMGIEPTGTYDIPELGPAKSLPFF